MSFAINFPVAVPIKLRALMSKVVEEKKALGVKLKDVEANAGQAVLAYINNSFPIDQKFAPAEAGI
jgi:hypothetical protein